MRTLGNCGALLHVWGYAKCAGHQQFPPRMWAVFMGLLGFNPRQFKFQTPPLPMRDQTLLSFDS